MLECTAPAWADVGCSAGTSRLVWQTSGLPLYAQAVLSQSKLTKLNYLYFYLWFGRNRMKYLLFKKSVWFSILRYCYLSHLSNTHIYDSYMLIIYLSISCCIFKERKWCNNKLDYSVSSCHSCISSNLLW